MNVLLKVVDYTDNQNKNNDFIMKLIEYFKKMNLDLNISFDYNDYHLKELTDRYLNAYSDINSSLISDQSYLEELNTYKTSSTTNDMYIIIAKSIPTGSNDWGEAIPGFVAVIKELNEKNIWHEIAHLFGAEDHYDPTTRKDSCDEPNCIMQYGKTEGDFCSRTISEIKTYVINSGK